jgi:hypothetical protein
MERAVTALLAALACTLVAALVVTVGLGERHARGLPVPAWPWLGAAAALLLAAGMLLGSLARFH